MALLVVRDVAFGCEVKSLVGHAWLSPLLDPLRKRVRSAWVGFGCSRHVGNGAHLIGLYLKQKNKLLLSEGLITSANFDTICQHLPL